MEQFDAIPAVPLSYSRLSAFSVEEITKARAAAYIADAVDPEAPVCRRGIPNYDEAPGLDDIQDWRNRMYVVWFCYLYENLLIIRKPLLAIEELILEFKAPELLDLPDRRLATLYAGAGGAEPLSLTDRFREADYLRPHYAKAIEILEK